MTGLSSDTAGLFNYTIKRDFRRLLDKEILSEGYDLFSPNPLAPVQPDVGDEDVTLVAMVRQQNNRTAVVVGTPTRLWAYLLNDGLYVADGYAEAGYDANDAPEWLLIGDGFSGQGNRWEKVNINGYLVLNNGVDLPVTYRVGDANVKPIYELREQGVASVGTISELNGILVCQDIKLLKGSVVPDVMYPIPLGDVTLSPPATRYWRFPTGATVLTEVNPGAKTYQVGVVIGIAGNIGSGGEPSYVAITHFSPRTAMILNGGAYVDNPNPATSFDGAETFSSTAVLDAAGPDSDSIALESLITACAGAGVARATAREDSARTQLNLSKSAYAAATLDLVRANAQVAGLGEDVEAAKINAAMASMSSDLGLQAAGVAALNAVAAMQGSMVSASGDLQAKVKLAVSNVGIAKATYEAAISDLAVAESGVRDASLRNDPAGLSAAVESDPQILVGLRLMWNNGSVATIAAVNEVSGVVTLSGINSVTGPCMMENPLCYEAFTDETKLDHYQARVTWSMPGNPRRFGAVIPCTAYSGRRYVVMDYPAASVAELEGANFLFPGIGAGDGNLTLGVVRVNGRRVLVDGVAEVFDGLRAAVLMAEQALDDSAAASAEAAFSLTAANASLTAARQAMIDGVKAYPEKTNAMSAATATLEAAQAAMTPLQADLADAILAQSDAEILLAYKPEDNTHGEWVNLLASASGIMWVPAAATRANVGTTKKATAEAQNAISLKDAEIAAAYSKVASATADIPGLNALSMAMSNANTAAVAAKASSASVDATVASIVAALATARARVRSAISTDMMASDASGSIVGLYEDITDDGSRILKSMPLRGVLVIYKETSIFLMAYTGASGAPFQFERVPIPPGTTLHYRDTLVMVDGVAHFYAGRSKLFKFDLTNRVPVEFDGLKACKDTFFASADRDSQGVFAVDNPLTSELFFCFPKNADGDAMLRYDYDQGTASTSSFQMTAGGFVLRPEAGIGIANEGWFAMGVGGGVMRYGLVERMTVSSGALTGSKSGAVVTSSGPFFTAKMVGSSIQFSDGSLYAITGYTDASHVTVLSTVSQPISGKAFSVIPCIYHRSGQPYTGTMQSGMDPFGDSSSAKMMNAWTLLLSSDSPNTRMDVALRGAINPSGAVDVITDTMLSPQVHNLVPVTMRDYYIGDRVSVTGVNHLVEVVGRVFNVSGIDTKGFERQ